MDEDVFHSMSKGVFVIPFNSPTSAQLQSENATAGPSRTRPLQQLYTASVQHYERAHRAYEADRIAEQLDDIADWLEQASQPPILKLEVPIHRLPVAILQDATTSSTTDLQSLGFDVVILNGSDAVDLASVTRLIAIGLMGEESSTGRKTGRTGLDTIEEWYQRKRNKLPLLLYIQDAQMVPPSVLGELMYILTLHPSLPTRLLLSVPSTTHFLSSWTPLDLSTIALSILSTRNRRKNGGIEAILRAGHDAPIKISDELAEEIRSEEKRAGGGTLLAMKAIKWLLLRYSIDSPLARLAQKSGSNKDTLTKVQALVDAMIENPNDPTIPGRELFQIEPHPDLTSVLNPAPRISILHALSNAAEFVNLNQPTSKGIGESERSPSLSPTKTIQSRSTKKRAYENTTATEGTPRSNERQLMEIDADEEEEEEVVGGKNDVEAQNRALKELQVLFEFWKGAGRSVNLWDWLEGFSSSMLDSQNGEAVEKDRTQREGEQDPTSSGNKQGIDPKSTDPSLNAADGPDLTGEAQGEEQEIQPQQKHHQHQHQHDEEEEARLHAVFIRFVEEARMIGLIRARGKGRRADEVVKGVGLV
ncbi:hypothetical protein IAT40_006059 [Kwoniella sp. CBS 6097]